MEVFWFASYENTLYAFTLLRLFVVLNRIEGDGLFSGQYKISAILMPPSTVNGSPSSSKHQMPIKQTEQRACSLRSLKMRSAIFFDAAHALKKNERIHALWDDLISIKAAVHSLTSHVHAQTAPGSLRSRGFLWQRLEQLELRHRRPNEQDCGMLPALSWEECWPPAQHQPRSRAACNGRFGWI